MTCACAEPPFHYLSFERVALGMDPFHADVSIETCKACGTAWLVYLIEQEHQSRSGRWWRVPMSIGERPALANARRFVQETAWCFVGGSFHASTGRRMNAPIAVQ